MIDSLRGQPPLPIGMERARYIMSNVLKRAGLLHVASAGVQQVTFAVNHLVKKPVEYVKRVIRLRTAIHPSVSKELVKASNYELLDAKPKSLEVLFRECFEPSFEKLLMAEKVDDVVEAFKLAETRIGMAELSIAIMLFKIKEEEIWKKLGYSSLSDFIYCLPEPCKLSRQGFYNAVKTGYVLANFSWLNRDIDFNLQMSLQLLVKNYSKLHLLYIIFINIEHKNRSWLRNLNTKDVFAHFTGDSYDDFCSYIKGLKVRVSKAPSHSRGNKSPHKAADKNHGLVPQKLDKESRAIYQAVKEGQFVVCISNAKPLFLTLVPLFVAAYVKKDFAELNRRTNDIQDIQFRTSRLITLDDRI